MTPYTAPLVRQVLEYKETHTLGETARHFRIPKSTVATWERTPPLRVRSGRAARFERNRAAVADALRSGLCTVNQIAKHAGVRDRTASTHLRLLPGVVRVRKQAPIPDEWRVAA